MAGGIATGAAAVRFCVTDRFGGVSAPPYDQLNLGDHVGDDPEVVEENRRLLAHRVGVNREQLVFMRQVHGADVAVVDRPVPPGDLPTADALVTATPGLLLAALVADCAPVLLSTREPGVVAVAHAGRRGLVARVVPAALAAMQELGADPADVEALVGPAVCGECYEVPGDLQAQVARTDPAAVCATRSGTAGVDVRAGLVAQLRAAGVGTVRVDPRCTIETPELFSYRRDGVTGRFAAVALITGAHA
jgi:YfiH family protein